METGFDEKNYLENYKESLGGFEFDNVLRYIQINSSALTKIFIFIKQQYFFYKK